MLSIINNLPEHVLGVRATGEVNKEDLDSVLLPALKEKADLFDEIRYLLVLETDVSNWTAGAWFKDAIAGVQNFTKWKKIAVVTDQEGVEKVTDVFSFVVPGDSKGFKPHELEEAKAWVSA